MFCISGEKCYGQADHACGLQGIETTGTTIYGSQCPVDARQEEMY
jgi:hypothetical protein